MVFKQILEDSSVCGQDSLGAGPVPVVVCCEDDNGLVQEHLDYLSSF